MWNKKRNLIKQQKERIQTLEKYNNSYMKENAQLEETLRLKRYQNELGMSFFKIDDNYYFTKVYCLKDWLTVVTEVVSRNNLDIDPNEIRIGCFFEGPSFFNEMSYGDIMVGKNEWGHDVKYYAYGVDLFEWMAI